MSKDLITHRDIDEWGFYTKFDMTLNECFDYFSKAWGDWKNLHPTERHLKQKTKMLNNLCSVDVVTAVIPEHMDDIRKWLDYNNIIYGDLVRSTEKEKLDYDIYIDDASKNIIKIYEAGKIGLLYNQAWNRDVQNQVTVDPTKPYNAKIERIYNLYHAIDVIRTLV